MAILSFLFVLLTMGYHPPVESTPKLPPTILTGTWKGTLTQDRGGYQPDYYFELTLAYQDGYVRGHSYVSVNNIYAGWELSGTFDGNRFQFRETSLGEHTQLDDLYWCLKEATLHLKMVDYQWVLYGNWTGTSELGPCIPGKIHLTKVVPQV